MRHQHIVNMTRLLLSICALGSLFLSISAQDIIRLDFQDSILAEVKGVSDKYVTYRLNPYFEEALDSIKLRKVTDIKYANGELEILRKDYWVKTYSPCAYLVAGGFLEEFWGGSLGPLLAAGLGHSGVFRISKSGIALVYSVETRFGRSSHQREDSVGYYTITSTKNKFFWINLDAGIDYRYLFNDFAGLFVSGLIGTSYLKFSSVGNYYRTPIPTFGFSSGIYVKRWKYGVKYVWGKFVRENSGGTDTSLIPEEEEYNANMFSFTFSYFF